jgi:hypothetical protein
MGNVRRWYVYLVSAISLQAVAWAVIFLLRHLVAGRPYGTMMALAWQLSLVVIGLPIYLGHWLWAQRLARAGLDERGAWVRRVYLYGMLAGFLAPFATDAYGLLNWLLGVALGSSASPLPGGVIQPVDSLAAMVVTAALWFYHRQVLSEDDRVVSEEGAAGAVRRLYVLGVAAAGLLMTVYALSDLLLRLILLVFGPADLVRPHALAGEIARLLVGLGLWLVFWRQAERLYEGPDEGERESVLRKIYLYAVAFVAALAVVSAATVALAGLFRWLLGVPAESGFALQRGCATLIAIAPIWVYQARVLQGDIQGAAGRPEQAALRRVYLYLIAGVGLAACLIGLGGDLSVVIRGLARSEPGRVLAIQLAYYSAALLAGLPVWVLPWREAQALAATAGGDGSAEVRSLARRIYLYFYLFAATMTVLSGAVYIVSRLIGRLLGAAPMGNLASQLAQAIALSLLGVGLWLYHSGELRRDNRRIGQEAAARLSQVRVTILDGGDGAVGAALAGALQRRLPALQPACFSVSAAGIAASEPAGADPAGLFAALREADIVVGPWTAVLAGQAGSMGVTVAQALAASPARKVLVPISGDGWLWAGVHEHLPALLEQAADAVAQIATGGQAAGPARLGVGGIIAVIAAGLALLPFLMAVLGALTRPID